MEVKKETTSRDDFNIFVISDGTGKTALSVVQAALVQFELPRVNILPFTKVRHWETIENILDMVRIQDLVVYTLVNEEMASRLRAESVNRGIFALDLLGPIVEALKKASARQPRGKPGLFQSLEETPSHAEALEYSMEKSTGFSISNLDKADVIVFSVWYPHRDEITLMLAEKGLKCGFILLNPDLPLPYDLEEVIRESCKKGVVPVGIWINEMDLSRVRAERINALGLDRLSRKAQPEVVKKELDFAMTIYKKLGCEIIDITNLTTREISEKIANLINNKKKEEAS
ncbi:MAG: [pyruvate, water dikinase]-phosphate phosphotransferase / [pyruvate, water dikinase] kinase [Candidatus Atribacteria bacterium]|uniref:Kinase/pyrophosphorylase n=1 Tax=Thermatribacter velox TaxID=3039681 RepID=A0ABZ2Y7U8_9BACT|nr:[pyruvate, water dikinase]-phosphate phosphotransferase / [pyruvate, water dikinase] kinase [Candidatus Atribacteria bacterium]MDI3530873.1 [pyruvate, water dikinase]-phosphate phosphotransferase / [pyruvate, water dikinase] kinase [Candidatus Atribacteria bacterium]